MLDRAALNIWQQRLVSVRRRLFFLDQLFEFPESGLSLLGLGYYLQKCQSAFRILCSGGKVPNSVVDVWSFLGSHTIILANAYVLPRNEDSAFDTRH